MKKQTPKGDNVNFFLYSKLKFYAEMHEKGNDDRKNKIRTKIETFGTSCDIFAFNKMVKI